MRNFTNYADFYIDYDLEDPDNQTNKQYIFINPHTNKATKRRKPPVKKMERRQMHSTPRY